MIYEFPRETHSVKIFPGMGREGSGKIPRTKMFVGLHLKFTPNSTILIKNVVIFYKISNILIFYTYLRYFYFNFYVKCLRYDFIGED